MFYVVNVCVSRHVGTFLCLLSLFVHTRQVPKHFISGYTCITVYVTNKTYHLYFYVFERIVWNFKNLRNYL